MGCFDFELPARLPYKGVESDIDYLKESIDDEKPLAKGDDEHKHIQRAIELLDELKSEIELAKGKRG